METKEQLKQVLLEWKKLYTETKVLSDELSKRRKEKKRVEELLKKTMSENNIGNFELNGGQLSYIKREIKKPITQKFINTFIRSMEQDQERADTIIQQIYEAREVVQVEKIVFREDRWTSVD